jgi:hypothetical protein
MHDHWIDSKQVLDIIVFTNCMFRRRHRRLNNKVVSSGKSGASFIRNRRFPSSPFMRKQQGVCVVGVFGLPQKA